MKLRALSIVVLTLGLCLTGCSTSSGGETDSGEKNNPLNPTFTVSFDSKGGSAVPSQTVEYGAKVTKPDDPTKNGYTFDKWTYKGEEWSFIGYSVTEDMTLDANWTLNEYSLSFSILGRTTYISGMPDKYTIEDTIEISGARPYDASVLAGYTFEGWFDNDNYTGSPIAKIENRFGDLVLYGKVTPIVYTITFVTYTDETIEPIVAPYNTPITAPAKPTRDGYTFLYWTTQGSTNAYSFDKMPSQNLTLYAYWTEYYSPCLVFYKDSYLQEYYHVRVNKYYEGYEQIDHLVIPSTYKGEPVKYVESLEGMAALKELSLDNTAIEGLVGSLSGCDSIKELVLPSTVIIGKNCVTNMASLEYVEINSSNVEWRASMISNCPALKRIKIASNRPFTPTGQKVTTGEAIYNCESLEELEIVKCYDNSWPKNSFVMKCPNLKRIITGEESTNGARIITDYLFQDTKIHYVIPGNLEEGCTITLPSGKKTLDYYACAYNNKVKKMILPEGFTTLSDYSLIYCENLENLELPSTFKYFGDTVLLGCSKLTAITFNGTMATWTSRLNDSSNKEDFFDGSSVTTIHCTDGDITR